MLSSFSTKRRCKGFIKHSDPNTTKIVTETHFYCHGFSFFNGTLSISNPQIFLTKSDRNQKSIDMILIGALKIKIFIPSIHVSYDRTHYFS